jgi:hypothetical protein
VSGAQLLDLLNRGWLLAVGLRAEFCAGGTAKSIPGTGGKGTADFRLKLSHSWSFNIKIRKSSFSPCL